ncbi:MAG: hypothetical protein ACREN2_02210 [Candidatus Dormibacteria bacterium]
MADTIAATPDEDATGLVITDEIEQWQLFQTIADRLSAMAAARRRGADEYEVDQDTGGIDEAIMQALHARYCISPQTRRPTAGELEDMLGAVIELFDERCPFGTTDLAGNLAQKNAELESQLKEFRANRAS